MRISVVGCGYLGAVHAASTAQLGHNVIGIASSTRWRSARSCDRKILDGRNALERARWQAAGWSYQTLGRRQN